MLTTGQISDIMYQLFVYSVQLGGPILIISMVVGIIISIRQAATQIHEQTLTFVPKLIVIGIILVSVVPILVVALKKKLTMRREQHFND